MKGTATKSIATLHLLTDDNTPHKPKQPLTIPNAKPRRLQTPLLEHPESLLQAQSKQS